MSFRTLRTYLSAWICWIFSVYCMGCIKEGPQGFDDEENSYMEDAGQPEGRSEGDYTERTEEEDPPTGRDTLVLIVPENTILCRFGYANNVNENLLDRPVAWFEDIYSVKLRSGRIVLSGPWDSWDVQLLEYVALGTEGHIVLTEEPGRIERQKEDNVYRYQFLQKVPGTEVDLVFTIVEAEIHPEGLVPQQVTLDENIWCGGMYNGHLFCQQGASLWGECKEITINFEAGDTLELDFCSQVFICPEAYFESCFAALPHVKYTSPTGHTQVLDNPFHSACGTVHHCFEFPCVVRLQPPVSGRTEGHALHLEIHPSGIIRGVWLLDDVFVPIEKKQIVY